MEPVKIIGAGLAGCEAAWQLVQRDIPVILYEMRPAVMTPAHRTGGFAELVCSNSLRAAAVTNGVGLLKEEMRRLGSLVMAAADATAVPAGGALAVDRERFSALIEEKLRRHPLVEVRQEEVTAIPCGTVIVAAGPLASPALSRAVQELIGEEELFFHDAIAPIVDAASIDMHVAFFASRYDKGSGSDYLNCPMTKEQYGEFYTELLAAEVAPLHGFEKEKHFSGCMPVESMARLGRDAIRFGPLKPVGIRLPDGGSAYAVVQLRKEDTAGTAYNIVGFQTRLKQGEQRRVFRMIPGLENADFLRYGSMHRNTYLNAPRVLDPWQRLRGREDLFFAGQITGVEGYVESAASGLLAGMCAAAYAVDKPLPVLPPETACGSMLRFLQTPRGDFQPSNVNFGLFLPLELKKKLPKKERYQMYADRALRALAGFLERQNHDG
ncbi:MAG: methylenetetrahydrofolate--tRNA-(uracil(54)-C(5))-methyltransferase (FADH(2)-oxidizing) TrmFO [Firmicutes bacterium]|nr:methylenetetrahydrofolate--tRNA-(uracil(54)-C(5))-methyltransferase (FADH(2)-oxidizing) TrmFO [Bacillota bacterium]